MSRLHALLVGIDGYLPNEPFGAGKPGYAPLVGCVNDVDAVEEYLLREYRPVVDIIRLTASSFNAGEAPPEPREAWPTYENLLAGLERLGEAAAPGDQVYFHYSGHGAIVPTCLPDRKGARGVDETLVPMNIGEPGARHLRDVELVSLLRRMWARGIFVTVVLDCCHSGGAMRGSGILLGPGGLIPRGVPLVDTTPRPAPQIPLDALREAWGDRGAPGTRDGREASALRAAEGWVMLMACGPTEQAFPVAAPDGQYFGSLTYEWIQALGLLETGATYGELYDVILPRIRKSERRQTPMLYGARQRQAFAKDFIPESAAVAVSRVDADGRIVLNTGQMQGVVVGARFALFPPGALLARPEDQLAEAEVVEVGAVDSFARVVDPQTARPIEAAARAMLLNRQSVRLENVVRVVEADGFAAGKSRNLFDGVKTALLADRSGFVRLAPGIDRADFEVRLNRQGEWEIVKPWGEPLDFPRVPSLPASDAKAAQTLVERLRHLTKFQHVAQLANRDPQSPLQGKLIVEWVGGTDKRVRARPGETLRLRIANRSSYDLYVTALVLRSDGSVQWGFLGVERGQFLLFPGRTGEQEGEDREFEVEAGPAADPGPTIERIQVFAATKGVTNFGWLELPAWGGPPTRRALRNDNPLEVLLAALAGEFPAQRRVVVSGADWTVETVELQVTP